MNSGGSKLPSKTAGTNLYSIHQKKALSELCRTILLVVANSADAEVTCVFNFSHTNLN